jgi:hypothetical protein
MPVPHQRVLTPAFPAQPPGGPPPSQSRHRLCRCHTGCHPRPSPRPRGRNGRLSALPAAQSHRYLPPHTPGHRGPPLRLRPHRRPIKTVLLSSVKSRWPPTHTRCTPPTATGWGRRALTLGVPQHSGPLMRAPPSRSATAEASTVSRHETCHHPHRPRRARRRRAHHRARSCQSRSATCPPTCRGRRARRPRTSLGSHHNPRPPSRW